MTLTNRYKPFGQDWGTENNEIGYTGHKFDADLDLSYMQARYYDPVIGRFYSNDPLGFRDIHSFNRYAYANNNPYRYVDPDGKATVALGIEVEGVMGVGGGGQVGVFINYDSKTGDLTVGTFSETKIAFGEDAGAAISLQYSGGGLSDFSGTNVTGELDLGPITLEGGSTVDSNGEISEDSQVVVGVEVGVGLPVGGSANIITTTIESSSSVNITEKEPELERNN